MVQPTVRKNFADTALWVAKLDTKADGTAEVELTMPENLTTWKSQGLVDGQRHARRPGQMPMSSRTRT